MRSGDGTSHTIHDEAYLALPTTVSGTFTENPGAGSWLYILIYTASLDPDVAVEFYEVVDSVTVVWPTANTTDGDWAFLRQGNPPATEDGDWSQLRQSPVPRTVDGDWSGLRSTTPAAAPSTDSEWSPIQSAAVSGSTTDSPWTLLHVILPPFDPTNRPPVVHPQQPAQISQVVIDGGGRNAGAGATYSGEDPDPGDTIVQWQATISQSGWRVEALRGGGFNSGATFDINQDYFVRGSEYAGTLFSPQYMLRSREFRVRCRDNHQAWSEYETMLINVVQPVHGSNLRVDSFTERPDRRQPNIWAFRHGSTRNASVGGVHYQYLTPAEARASRVLWAGSISYAAYRLYELIQGTEPNVVVHNYRNIHPSLNASLVNGLITFTLKPDAQPTEVGEYSSSHNWTVLGEVLIDGGGAGNLDYWVSISGFLFISEERTDDSDWSSLASALPTADSEWSLLRRMLPAATTDGRWSPVARVTFEGTTDSEWSVITVLGALLPTIDIKANGQDVLTVATGAAVRISWRATNALSVTLDLLNDGIPDVPGHPLVGSFDYVAGTALGVFTYRASAVGADSTVDDTVAITVVSPALPTIDSEWSSVATLGSLPTTDSPWSSIEFLSAVVGATLDGEWSELPDVVPNINLSGWGCISIGGLIGTNDGREIGLGVSIFYGPIPSGFELQSGILHSPSTSASALAAVATAYFQRFLGLGERLIPRTARAGIEDSQVNEFLVAFNNRRQTAATDDCLIDPLAGSGCIRVGGRVNTPGGSVGVGTEVFYGPIPAGFRVSSGVRYSFSATDAAVGSVAASYFRNNLLGPDDNLGFRSARSDQVQLNEYAVGWERRTGRAARECLTELPTADSPWSLLNNELITEHGPWSEPVGLLTEDGEWSPTVGLLLEDSDWSDIVGPIVCDGAWGPLAVLLNEDGPWSVINTALETQDSAWSDIIGPIVCDGLWSPFAVLTNEDSEWSELVGLLTRSSRWSDIVGPVVCDGAWGPLAILLDATQDSEWSSVVELLYLDSEWSRVSNVAYSVRRSLSRIVHSSEWSKVSPTAYHARPGPSQLVVYRSAWSAVSNDAYRVRPALAVAVVYRGGWSAISGPAYRVRPSMPALIYYSAWSAVSNYAYRSRPGPPTLIVYHSEWSAVSNIAKQEREVLSVIGGAVPFLHIYEARRGMVEVGSLVGPAGSLLGTGFTEGVGSDRVIINPGITYGDVLDGDVTLQVYRTSRTAALTPSSFRFYLANMEGVDPNIQRVYYDVTPGSIVMGLIAHHVEVTATSTGIIYQRKTAEDRPDGESVEFSFGGVAVPASAELVVVALIPQHANEGLSRIVYQHTRVNNWYYYHGVPEIYVSEPVDIVADEDAFSYNGRDSANFQSPPHVGYASALVRQHQGVDRPWFEELLNRNHVITGQRVHILLRDSDGHYGKDFTGILQSPPLQHQDNIYDWRVTLQDPTTLMVQSFANSATLLGPQDAIDTRTVGALIRRVCQAYADRTAGLTLEDVLDPGFVDDHFPVPLAWFWTDYESERDILQRLVNTQGPPTGFHVNSLGQMVFTGCEARATPIQIGGATGIPVSQAVSFSDHVVDVANDARIPVSLHGWVLPDIATTPEQIYEAPTGLPEAVQVQLFETYSDNAIFDLARGGGITFDVNGEYRYRVRTAAPVLPTEAPTLMPPNPGFRITGVGAGVEVEQVAANLLEIVVKGVAGADVPEFQLLGAELKHFRTIENWTSQTVREENQTRFSRYLYHQREFSYGGYNSIAVQDAQLLADWVVRYYRKGIKTITLELFCSNHVQEALRLEPDRTPVRIAHNYGAGAPEQWIVRSRKRIYRDGHFWVEVVLDEDVMYSLGLPHSPLCAAYVAPDPSTSATYAVGNAGELTYTGTPAAALAIPQQGFLSAAPDLAATVLPIAAASDTPQTVLTRAGGINLFQLVAGTYKAAHFDLTRLEALNDSAFYADGLRANGLSLWLVEPKTPSDSYWAVANFNFRADGFDGDLPAAFHFLRVRYAALGAHSDVVLSFVAPNMTIHDTANHWITVAQEQPWLGDDAAAALRLNQHVIILDWQAFPMDAPIGSAGLLESPSYVNDAVVAADASPSTNVGGANGAQIVRRFGRA